MKTKRVISAMIGIIIALGLLMITGCGNTQKAVDRPVIAVTIVPEKTFVEAVCGDLAEVVVMVPPGNSPANYEPTPKEIEQFSKAKLYFAIGVPTEDANILPKAAEIKGMKIIKLQEEVKKTYPEMEIELGHRDPHIWLSPKRAKKMVETIAREMSELDSKNKETYTKNAQAYIAELDAVDEELQKSLEGVKNRKFIVFHPAFGYLADDYDLTMYALEEHGKEATPQRLQEMIDFAKAKDIKAIFYQAEISSKQAKAFAEEIGGKTVELAPLAPNYTENLKNMTKLMAEVMR